MKILGVIPARYASSRLLGKPLIKINGKTLLQRVVEGVQSSEILDEVIVASENQDILDHAKELGVHAEMTSDRHPTGTDRVAEVSRRHLEYDVVLNIQGDQPQVNPRIIKSLCQPFLDGKELSMSTIMAPIRQEEEINSPHSVKVITDKNKKAIYFSRSPIPYTQKKGYTYYKHIGLYGFTKTFLLKYKDLRQTPLEIEESLEQLRVLENGYTIYVEKIEEEIFELNTPEDIPFLEMVLPKD